MKERDEKKNENKFNIYHLLYHLMLFKVSEKSG